MKKIPLLLTFVLLLTSCASKDESYYTNKQATSENLLGYAKVISNKKYQGSSLNLVFEDEENKQVVITFDYVLKDQRDDKKYTNYDAYVNTDAQLKKGIDIAKDSAGLCHINLEENNVLCQSNKDDMIIKKVVSELNRQ